MSLAQLQPDICPARHNRYWPARPPCCCLFRCSRQARAAAAGARTKKMGVGYLRPPGLHGLCGLICGNQAGAVCRNFVRGARGNMMIRCSIRPGCADLGEADRAPRSADGEAKLEPWLGRAGISPARRQARFAGGAHRLNAATRPVVPRGIGNRPAQGWALTTW
jgi:hypothetical protein